MTPTHVSRDEGAFRSDALHATRERTSGWPPHAPTATSVLPSPLALRRVAMIGCLVAALLAACGGVLAWMLLENLRLIGALASVP